MSVARNSSQEEEFVLRLVTSVLRLTLPRRVRESVIGDLIEEYREDILPSRGGWQAPLWAIGQAISWSFRYRFHPASRSDSGGLSASLWNTLLGEIHQGGRTLSRAPLFVFVAVSMLALGIGATATIFSVINSVLLQPLRYPNAARVAMLWEKRLGPEARGTQSPASPANFTDWKTQSRTFQYMAAVRNAAFVLSGERTAERINAARVSADLFPLVGAAPLIGRPFLQEDDQPGSRLTVILSYGLWQRRFSGDPAITGKSIRLNDSSYSVVGVMPPEFEFPPSITVKGISGMEPADLWVPLRLGTTGLARDASTLRVFGLLAPGVAVSKAQAEMNAIAAGLKRQFPETNRNSEISIVPLQQQVVSNVAASLWLLFVGIGLVLIVVPLRKRRTSLVGWKFMPITPTDPFKWRHFPGEVMLLCVRWYLRYPLAYKHVSELLAERGVAVDPTCIWRWVQNLWTRAEQTLSAPSETHQQKLPYRRNLHQSPGRRQILVPCSGFGRPYD